MADPKVELDRFVEAVCMRVLEKFGAAKHFNHLRKSCNYVTLDLLSRTSRSVISFAFWIRWDFRSKLKHEFSTATPSDEQQIYYFDEGLRYYNALFGDYWPENFLVSLSVCTEYLQFAIANGFNIPLSMLAFKYKMFFDQHLRTFYEANGGLKNLNGYLLNIETDQLNNFQTAFIAEFCFPYEREYTIDISQQFIQKNGFNISLVETVYGIKASKSIAKNIHKEMCKRFDSIVQEFRRELIATGSGVSISENDRSNGSDEMSRNDLQCKNPAGKETLRENDRCFVEELTSTPKARLYSRSSSSEASLSSSSSSSGRESQPPFPTDREEKSLLLEDDLLSGRRGCTARVKDPKDKMPPKDPKGIN